MRYLLGPEAFWLLLYGAAAIIARLNLQHPTKEMDRFIETCWFYIPALSLLMLGLWWIPAVEKRFLLLRVWIAGIIGAHLVIERMLRGYSEQGPGIGMGYLAGLCLELAILFICTIVVLIKF